MAKTMVFRSVDGADYRVSVERTSVSGLAAFVKFTRADRYRPTWVSEDGTAWVESSKLHFVSTAKATAEGTVQRTTRKAATTAVAKRTAETLKGKMPTQSVTDF